MRRTKIVCTVGPACEDIGTLKKMIEAGMNVVRFNFSHQTHAEHKARVDAVRQAAKEMGVEVALMLDTKGPEIRTGIVKGDKINLRSGEEILLTSEEIEGTEKELSISYKNLPKEVQKGTKILIADGKLELECIETKENKILCKILFGGEIGSRKNVNVINTRVNLPSITEKDESDILFGIENDFDYLAASFIRNKEDVFTIREFINKNNGDLLIISKIENDEGLDNIDDIIRVSDGIMIARGDLGVQIPIEQIPIVQKQIIAKCKDSIKPVIVATQMLDSMINNPRPTRAEATDVANAVMDGTDAVMLSGETAAGNHPIEAIKTMDKIALTMENTKTYRETMNKEFYFKIRDTSIQTVVCKNACETAYELDAKAILVPTLSGNTARLLAHFHPVQPIIAATNSPKTIRRLRLVWGVYPIDTEVSDNSDDMISNAIKKARQKNYVENFDKVVIVAGVPIHSPIPVNLIKVHQISTVLSRGNGIMGTVASGKAIKALFLSEAIVKVSGEGNFILVTKDLEEDFLPFLKSVKGVILQGMIKFDINKIKEVNPDIVIVERARDCWEHIEDGLLISLKSTNQEGIVYEGDIEI